MLASRLGGDADGAYLEQVRDAGVVPPGREAAARIGDLHFFGAPAEGAAEPAAGAAEPAAGAAEPAAGAADAAGIAEPLGFAGAGAGLMPEELDVELDPLLEVAVEVREFAEVDLAAVDEDRGCAFEAHAVGLLLVLLDAADRVVRAHVGAELPEVEAEFLRVPLEVGLLEAILVVEEEMVHLPELPLL